MVPLLKIDGPLHQLAQRPTTGRKLSELFKDYFLNCVQMIMLVPFVFPSVYNYAKTNYNRKLSKLRVEGIANTPLINHPERVTKKVN